MKQESPHLFANQKWSAISANNHGDNSFGENLRIFPCYLSPYPSWSNSALLTRAFSIVIRISFTKIRISLFFLFNIRTEE